jgi:GntR family transcriptional regulator, transcriptional repressor for pyruvate dehydrogenase complex
VPVASVRRPRKPSGKAVDGKSLFQDVANFDSFFLDRQKLNEQIAEIIQQQISRGKLNAGDRLPPERELASMLKVNRATVREAIHLLSERGLVERKNGRGTRIKAMPPANVGAAISRFFVSNNCSHHELHDFRSVFEPKVAAFAADNARPEDVERLGTVLNELEDAWRAQDVERLASADAEFHFSLAVASHNALMLAVANGLKLVLERAMKTSHATFHSEESFRTHRLIYTAVARHDSSKAEQAMKHQMETSPFSEDTV